ncbi:hypothetical protein EMCRGX_G034336 [Ephydatia muelleri]|eukprot:Em0023g265a
MPGIKAGNHTSVLSSKDQNEYDEEFEPNTQAVDPRPLAGVIAFVDVRSGKNGCENRGEAVSHELDALGATISPRFTKDVTHVVFKDGKATVIEKAQKLGLFVVSVLWVDACKRANDRVSEAKYPAIVNDLTGSPVVLGKLKRIKSMQPKPLEEEVAKSLERSRKRKKREEPLTNARKVAADMECSPKPSLASADNHEEEEHKANDSDDSFDLPAVVFPVTPSNAHLDCNKSADHPQTTPTLGQSGQCNQTAPNIVNKICDSNPSEREKPSTPNVAKKPMQEKRTLPSAPVKVGGSVQSKQGKPALATEKGGTQESDQSNQMTPKKAGSWDQSAPDKPSVSGISKLSMKRSLQKEACNVANEEDGDEEMVTPVAHSAVEKMPATYSLTNSVKALQKVKNVAKTQSASKAQASEQGTSKADTRDPKRRSTEEATSEAKKKRRDKEVELKESASKAQASEQGTSKADTRDPKRRSTEEATSEAKKKRRSRDKEVELKEKPTLVMTSVAVQDQETVYAIVEKLENFEIAKTVCESTTHVICGGPRRTVNVLAGTAKGCWILSLEWVWKSLESGRWLEEEPYEMADEFPAARLFRLERQQQSGPLYRPTFFSSVGSIFISSNSSPSSQDLELLVSLGGGKISASQRKADVCVGCKAWSDDVKSISERWILDSISEHHLLRMEDYSLDVLNSKAASPEL